MRTKVKSVLPFIMVLFLIAFSGNLLAQSTWNASAENKFKTDVISFVQSCDNNFSDIKGKFSHANSDGSKEFEVTKHLGKFKTRLLQMPDSSYSLNATLKVSDDDDIDTVKELLKQMPDYKIYDSDNDSTIEVPEGADQVLVAKKPNSSIVVSATLFNENDTYILLTIRKKTK